MSSDAAELSSLLTALGDLRRRITAIAERRAGDFTRPDELATALFEVERVLGDALRRLQRALDRLG